MPNLSLGDLVTLVFNELATAIAQSADVATATQIKLGNVELDIPAHLRLQPAAETPAQLFVAMPSTLETPAPGRLGRVRLVIEPANRLPEESQS